jgi:copper chaperone NosL
MTLSNITRVLVAVGSLLIGVSFFVPLWQILLWAPQYPEGLTMKIWYNKLSGEIEIINGLNHYIGMKHISVEMFPEFGYIGPLIGLLMIAGLASALFKSARLLFLFTLMSYAYGIAALWDFYRWGYDYGHNLDPNAAIKVPDMSYQPPLIGYKNLLNFTSYSGPDTGAWIIIVVCLMATALWWWEFLKSGKKSKMVFRKSAVVALLPLMTLWSCNAEPDPIQFGKDECSDCRMTLTDKRFGAEIMTKKGKSYKFDDLNCLAHFKKTGSLPATEIAAEYVVCFDKPGTFLKVNDALFLSGEQVRSPMRGDVAAFSSNNEMKKAKADLGGGKELTWEAVAKLF